ncbi:ATP-binding protein [Hydrogenophaga sp.]|uniref:sensor histidine kinase n=1 Tax=Hydrogenophaga sp. TaxID=1904254 RepID=UPI0035B06770
MTHDPRFPASSPGLAVQGTMDAYPWRHAMEAAPVAMWVIEQDQVLWANRACAQLFRAPSPDSFAGRSLAQWLGPAASEALQSAMRSDAPRGAVPGVSLRLNRHDGTARDVEVTVTHLHWQGRQWVQMALVDVTLRASELRQLLRSRRTLRELSASLVDAREEERRHFARELHDELGQRLTALKLELSACAMQHEVTTSEPVFRTLDETVAAVRRIAADLRPPMLDDLGPVAAIEWLCRQHQARTGLQVQVRIDVLPERLPAMLATPAYRIVQEALTNVARHARATQVQVRLFVRDGQLVISVQDDGVGFGVTPLRPTGSFGLIGIRERALMLGGTVWLGRGEWGGAHLEARLPVRSVAAAPAPVRDDGPLSGFSGTTGGDGLS